MKIFISLILLLITGSANTQVVNGGFEDWIFDSDAWGEVPSHWETFLSHHGQALSKDTFAYEGLYSLHIIDGFNQQENGDCKRGIIGTFDLPNTNADSLKLSFAYRCERHNPNHDCGIKANIQEFGFSHVLIAKNESDTFKVYDLMIPFPNTEQFDLHFISLANSSATDVCLNMGDHWIDAVSVTPININPSSTNDRVEQIALFPNPVTSHLNLRRLEIENHIKLSIYDIEGRLISQIEPVLPEIDLSELETGVYHLLVVSKGGQRSVHTFVKD